MRKLLYLLIAVFILVINGTIAFADGNPIEIEFEGNSNLKVNVGEKVSVKYYISGGSGTYSSIYKWEKFLDDQWMEAEGSSGNLLADSGTLTFIPENGTMVRLWIHVEDSGGRETEGYSASIRVFGADGIDLLSINMQLDKNEIVLGESITATYVIGGGNGQYQNIHYGWGIYNHGLWEFEDTLADASQVSGIISYTPTIESEVKFWVSAEDSEGRTAEKYSEIVKVNSKPGGNTGPILNNDIAPPLIKNVTVDKLGQTLHSGDVINLTIEIEEESDISSCQIVFRNIESNATINCSKTFSHNEDGIYSMEYTINNSMNNGKWVLSSTYIIDYYGNYTGENQIPDKSAVFFFVDGNAFDTSAPIIKNVTVDKQGQTLHTGDVINLTVEIEEEHNITTCQLVFKNVINNSTINCMSSFNHREDETYSFEYTINDSMNNGKWVLSHTYISDQYDNYTGENQIQDHSAIYFFVEDNASDTTAPVIKNVTIDKQGQILHVGDVINLTIVIEEESDISTCQVVFRNEDTGSTINCSKWFTHRENETYTMDDNIYDSMSNGKWVLSHTYISDKYGNYTGENQIQDKASVFFYVMPSFDDLNIVMLPGNLRIIQAEAFSGLACDVIIVSDVCESIGERAFADCEKLKYAIVPESVSEVANSAFAGCDNVYVIRTGP